MYKLKLNFMKFFTYWKKIALILAMFLPLSFSSLAQCTHTLEMFDSYGDGWNSASVTVSVNGTAVLSNQTMAGSYATATFTASTGDAITTTWSSGSYDYECTYNILDGGATIIGSDGPTPTGISTPILANCPSCFQPSNLTVSNISYTSAEISWTTGGATNWNIEYGPAGFTPGTGTFVYNVTNPYTITPLTHNTAYDVYVQDSCGVGDLSAWAGPLSFYTPYDLQCTVGTQTVLFSENWETGVGSWTGDIGTANGEWQFGTGTTGSTNTGPSGAHDGSQYIYFEASGAGSGGNASMVSPPIDLAGGNGSALLSFYAHGYGVDVVGASLTIGASTSPTGPFTTVFTDTFTTQLQSAEADPYIPYYINLDAYLGQTIYLEFHYNNPGSYYSDFAIDLIEVSSCVTCPAPSNLTASSSPAGTSADLDWTTGGSTVWNVEYGPAGFVKGTGTVEAVTSKPHTISGLTVATEYDFYVQDSCGVGDLSSWVGPYSFTTSAPPLNGVYTIGDTAGGAVYDFPSFSSAARYLSIGGVSGQVTFNVASDVYNEQVFVDTIIGASPTNTVTFQAATGNPADVELTYESTLIAENYTVCLEGAKYLRLKNLTISATGSSYARVIELKDSANYNIVDSCILNGASSTSSSSNYAVIYKTSSTGHAEYNSFSNNQINNGSYGMYYYGNSTTSLSSGLVVENNDFNNQYSYGMRLYTLNAPYVNKNKVISNSPYATFYGIYAGYCDNGLEISQNIVEHSQSGYGIQLYYCDGTSSLQGLVANNMVSYYDGTSTLYGLYHYNSSYQNYVNNSVNVEGTSATTRAMYVYTSGSYSDLTLTNNILSNSANSGYAIYFSSTAMTNVASDYNVFYAPNATALSYYGGAQADLAAWQTATTFDANSHEINPYFVDSYNDLHIIGGPSVDGKGTPIAMVTDDIDGDLRNATTPDIGADEYTPLGNDIGVVEVTSPVAPMTAGVNNVEVVIQNFGTNTITTATIGWDVDGSPQTAFSWSGSILPYEKDTVIIGTYNFVSGTYHIQSWTSNPNSSVDEDFSNDTLNYSVCTPLSGIYSIGSTGDYNSFSEATSALINCGISGAVSFNVMPGTYYDYVSLPVIPGSSAANTVSFDGGDAAVVTLYDSVFTAAILLQGTDYITFKNLTIVNTLTTDAWGVKLMDTADYVTIDSCVFNMYYATGVNDVYAISASDALDNGYSEGNNANFCVFSNNVITGGDYGIRLEGETSTADFMKGMQIINNDISMVDDYGIYLDNQDSIIIKGNKIYDIQSSFGDGMSLYDLMNFYISENYINAPDYGLYIPDGNFDGTPNSTRSYITNNMIISETDYAVYLDDFEEADIFHNTFKGEPALRLNDIVNLDIRNNIFYSETDFAFESDDDITDGVINYNIYYTPATNTNFVDIGTNTYADLAAWQTGAATYNINSVELDPMFVAVEDLHILSPLANDLGDNTVGITVDIDGDTRPMSPSTTVDIGADEYTPNSDDAMSIDILSDISGCGDSITTISVVVKNLGADTIFTLPVVLNISNALTLTLNATYNGSLAFAEMDTLIMGTINTYAGGNYDMEAYTELSGDQDLSNDTIYTSFFYSSNFPPTVQLMNVCYGDSTYLVADYIGGSIEWYDSLSGGNVLGFGDTLWTSPLYNDTTFYVGYASLSGDTLNTLWDAGNGQAGNMFDVTVNTTLTIDSFYFSPDYTGSDVIEVYYKQGTYVGFETNAAAWTLLGSATVNVTSPNVPTVAPIGGLTILSGETYAIYFTTTSQMLDYTNGDGTNQNYSDGNMTIDLGVGKSYPFGATYDPRIWNGAIAYSQTSCTNDRTQVDVILDPLPVAEYSYTVSNVTVSFAEVDFTDISVNADSVKYDFGDGITSTQANPTHNYTSNGTFNAYQLAYNQCGTDTFWLDVIVSDVSIEDFNTNYQVDVYPNPNNGRFTTDIYVDNTEKAALHILTMEGRKVYAEDLGTFNGRKTINIDIDLPKGVYFVQVQMLHGNIVRKLIVQ